MTQDAGTGTGPDKSSEAISHIGLDAASSEEQLPKEKAAPAAARMQGADMIEPASTSPTSTGGTVYTYSDALKIIICLSREDISTLGSR